MYTKISGEEMEKILSYKIQIQKSAFEGIGVTHHVKNLGLIRTGVPKTISLRA